MYIKISHCVLNICMERNQGIRGGDFRSKQIGTYYLHHKCEQRTSIYLAQFSHSRNEKNTQLARQYLDKMQYSQYNRVIKILTQSRSSTVVYNALNEIKERGKLPSRKTKPFIFFVLLSSIIYFLPTSDIHFQQSKQILRECYHFTI